ncbi:hypothetical protein ABES02_00240 [Neobacillus pocheonensis]|uniref:hypothetical protein n=1 Tax=Neobacillus pocheonensis TaxID=363869 RepID=UPI003D2BDE58
MVLKLLKANSSKEELVHPNQMDYHIRVKYPFDSEMAFFDVKETELEEENTVVFIENIGPGGLRFLSNLYLEDNQEISFSLKEILKDKIHLPGNIIWREEVSQGLYQYGVHFNIPEDSRSFINELLYRYSETYFQRTEP